MNNSNLDIPFLFDQLELQLKKQLSERAFTDPLVIGIHSGGAWVAKEMHHRLQIKETLGVMDISFYRDDFSQIGIHPQVKQSRIPLDIEGRDIILVDDVFYTGRTVRAALNEIFDFGRPNQVILAVLVERDGQQIPMKPDCVGASITLQKGMRIKLAGPDPLQFLLQSTETI